MTMKPMMIVPPGVLTDPNVKQLRDNGICVVVAKDPSRVRFVDPIPATSSRTNMEQAAIGLSRKLLNWPWGDQSYSWNKGDFCNMYIELLLKGTSLDSRGTVEEQCDEAYRLEKLEESRRMAREDAKAERAKKREAEAKAAQKTAA